MPMPMPSAPASSSIAQALLNVCDLFGSSGLFGGRPALGQDGSRLARRAEDQRSRGDVAGGGAVVDERVSLLGIEKLFDVGSADFHFERGGDAVEGFDALAGEILAVLVQVDEAGSDDEAGGVDDAASSERGGGDAGDFSVADADVADGVEGSLGVDDAAAFEHKIVLICRLGGLLSCDEGGDQGEYAGKGQTGKGIAHEIIPRP